MITFISMNSISLGKLLKRYKLISKGKHEITKAALKRYSTWSEFESITKKFCFKDSNINKN